MQLLRRGSEGVCENAALSARPRTRRLIDQHTEVHGLSIQRRREDVADIGPPRRSRKLRVASGRNRCAILSTDHDLHSTVEPLPAAGLLELLATSKSL